MATNEGRFILVGDPVPQGRPRFSIRGRGKNAFVQTYDPEKSAAEKKRIRKEMRIFMLENGIKIYSCPLAVDLKFYFPVPKSYSKKKADQALTGIMPHTKKPDVDNCAKLVLDACNSILFEDDSQIVRLTASKDYSSRSGTIMTFKPFLFTGENNGS
ncbi:RusA family crossover junction endodeoxyribonuclease [uncultured Paraglaciecola sp.]|uniref:RusA family crossover junction endodeoxyribonuclease n=1 Tax=uncultured Paraglaciecola sp. TaxID=1765024 RepID=UPI0026215BC8|nr:RusA family crossover junction endodeoxyribonuclease [uncultured Paraglaciecola sp.]